MGRMPGSMAATVLAVLIALFVSAARAERVDVTEFRHGTGGQYFLTASTFEGAAIEAAGVYRRTGHGFRAYDRPAEGLVPVCRYVTGAFPPRTLHFHSAEPDECAVLQASRTWQFEGDVFHVHPATVEGSCPSGTGPVYRLYNDGQGRAPGHRYVTQPAERARLVARGWVPEGHGAEAVAFCVPVDLSDPVRLLPVADSEWVFRYHPDVLTTVHHGVIFGPVVPSADPGAGDEVQDLFWSTFAYFDPYLGRLVVHLEGRPPARLVVEYIAPGVLRGCLHQLVDWNGDWTQSQAPARFGDATFGPCLPFDAYQP